MVKGLKYSTGTTAELLAWHQHLEAQACPACLKHCSGLQSAAVPDTLKVCCVLSAVFEDAMSTGTGSAASARHTGTPSVVPTSWLAVRRPQLWCSSGRRRTLWHGTKLGPCCSAAHLSLVEDSKCGETPLPADAGACQAQDAVHKPRSVCTRGLEGWLSMQQQPAAALLGGCHSSRP